MRGGRKATGIGIPAGVRDKIAKYVASALTSLDMIEQFNKKAFEPMSMTPAKLTTFVQNEQEAAARVVKAARIKLQ